MRPLKTPRAGVLFMLELAAATLALLIAAYYSIQTKAPIIDPDIWWHIRVGDWIAEHATVPRTGIFSQHADRAWVAYSWGFDLLVSTVHRLFGLPGIVGFVICLQIAVSLVFLLAIRRVAIDPWWSCLIAALSIYAFYVEPLRPVLLTLLFFTVELLIILEAERRADDNLLAWLAPLFLVWANCHIQFVYGMFVFGLYVATRLIGLWRSGEIWTAVRTRNRLAGSLAFAVVCSCIGPNHVLPYRVAITYAVHPVYYQTIQEMAALSFRRPEHYVQLVLLMGACFAVGRTRRVDLFRVLLLIATGIVAFRSTRDAWFVAMTSGFLLAEWVGNGATVRTGRPVLHPIRPPVIYALAAVLALAVSVGLARRQGIDMPALTATVDRVYPLRAVEFIESSNLEGPMYNDFNWGGFLISRLPAHPVSIDPRADLYGEELFTRSLRTTRAEPGWQDDPDIQRARFILVQRWYPLAAALATSPQYRLVYEDHVAMVFARLASDH